MRERKYLEDLFGKMDVTGDRNVAANRSTLQEDDRKRSASQPSTRANMTGVARLPFQQERDHEDEGDEPRTSSFQGSYVIDEGLHYEIFCRMAYSMEHLTYFQHMQEPHKFVFYIVSFNISNTCMTY